MSTRNARTPYRAPYSVLRREPVTADQSVGSGLQRDLASEMHLNQGESASSGFQKDLTLAYWVCCPTRIVAAET